MVVLMLLACAPLTSTATSRPNFIVFQRACRSCVLACAFGRRGYPTRMTAQERAHAADDIPFYWDDAPTTPPKVGTVCPLPLPAASGSGQSKLVARQSKAPARVPTPNMDRVRSEGVTFTRAYCASPMCAPSRFGVLTGFPDYSVPAASFCGLHTLSSSVCPIAASATCRPRRLHRPVRVEKRIRARRNDQLRELIESNTSDSDEHEARRRVRHRQQRAVDPPRGRMCAAHFIAVQCSAEQSQGPLPVYTCRHSTGMPVIGARTHTRHAAYSATDEV
jgi:hypothetical protein